MTISTRTLAVSATLCVATAAAQTVPATAGAAQRDALKAALEALPTAQLRSAYLRCDLESSRRLFGFDEALPCVVVGDVLLKRDFDGNFDAMLAWWRIQRDAAGLP